MPDLKISELDVTDDPDGLFVPGARSGNNYQFDLGDIFVLPSLTAGSILFSDGSTIAQDNANFFWDNTNNIFYVGNNTGAFTNTKGHFESPASAALNSYSQVNSSNKHNGTSSSSDWVATADTGTDSTNYIDMGINSSTYSDSAYTIGGALSAYLYSNGNAPLTIGTQSNHASASIIFHTGGTLIANQRMAIHGTTGVVKIGASTVADNATGLGLLRIGQGTSFCDIGEHSAASAGIWLLSAAPTSTNYSIRATSGSLIHNASAQVLLRTSNTTKLEVNSSEFLLTPGAAATGVPTPFMLTTPLSTAQTAGTETVGFYVDMATNSIQHASNTAITTNRDFLIKARTHRFASAIGTITDGYTVYVDGAPIVGTNAAITRSWALGVAGNAQIQNLMYVGAAGVVPTSYVHIAAGTTTRAAIELTSGTNLTTARAGAFEYDGTNLFFTRTGTTRESVLTGIANEVSPTNPDRTITVNVAGTTLYIHAKTTND